MANIEETLVGVVTHYYGKIGVAILELKADVAVGDQLHYKGGKTDFEEPLSEMQIEHQNVEKAKKGESVGVKVSQPVKEGDEAYRA